MTPHACVGHLARGGSGHGRATAVVSNSIHGFAYKRKKWGEGRGDKERVGEKEGEGETARDLYICT